MKIDKTPKQNPRMQNSEQEKKKMERTRETREQESKLSCFIIFPKKQSNPTI